MKIKSNLNSNAQQSGVAMLEVLIAIVVVAFGFLALLKLQVTSLNNVAAADQRYLAASLASAMGERIRANGIAQLLNYDNVDTDSNTRCGGTDIVSIDVCQWSQDISAASRALPGGRGRIDVNASNAVIRISWNEKRMNAEDGSGNALDSETASYFLEVPQ